MYFYFTRDFKADLRYIFRLKTHQNDHLSLKFLVVLKEFSYKKTFATDFVFLHSSTVLVCWVTCWEDVVTNRILYIYIAAPCAVHWLPEEPDRPHITYREIRTFNVTSSMTLLITIWIRTLKLSQYLKNILISYQKKFGAKMLINNEVTGVFLNPLTTLLSAFLSLCHIIYIRKQTTHFLQNMQSTLRKVLTNN